MRLGGAEDGAGWKAGIAAGASSLGKNLPPERFLAGLKRKAELPEGFWGPEVRLWRFTVESHREGL